MDSLLTKGGGVPEIFCSSLCLIMASPSSPLVPFNCIVLKCSDDSISTVEVEFCCVLAPQKQHSVKCPSSPVARRRFWQELRHGQSVFMTPEEQDQREDE